MVGLRQRAMRSPPIAAKSDGEHVDEAFWLHLLDVGAGGKRLLAAGHDDAADLVVGLEVVDRGGDLAEHAERQRIQHLRPVQRDDADRALAVDEDVFERAHKPPHMKFAGTLPAGGMGFKGREGVPRTRRSGHEAATP